MSALLDVILPVFIVIGFGYVAARWLGFREGSVDGVMQFAQGFALPLLLFAFAARRISLTTLGLMQYFTPVFQFLLGVFYFGEVMSPTRWLGFLLVWASLAKVDEVTRGDARVIPSRQLQVVQSLDGGVVQEILVREGQVVDPGQLLLRIEPEIRAPNDPQSLPEPPRASKRCRALRVRP